MCCSLFGVGGTKGNGYNLKALTVLSLVTSSVPTQGGSNGRVKKESQAESTVWNQAYRQVWDDGESTAVPLTLALTKAVFVIVCRKITTLNTQNVTAVAPGGELPFRTLPWTALACPTQ